MIFYWIVYNYVNQLPYLISIAYNKIVSIHEINTNYTFFLRSFILNLNCKFDDNEISKGAKIRNRYN